MLAHPRVVVGEGEPRLGHLARAGLAAKLPEGLGGLGDPRGAEGVAAADQPAARVDHDLPAVVGQALLDEAAALALRAEAELLVRDDLRDGEAVVHLGEIHVVGSDAGHPVRLFRGPPHRRPARVVLGERGQREPVQGLAGAPDPHGPVRQIAGPLLAGDDDGGGAVGDGRAHEQAKRGRDHAGAEHLVEGRALLEVRVGILARVVVVLHADQRHLLLGRAVARHVRLGRQGEAGRRGEPVGGLPLSVDARAHVEEGLVRRRHVQLLDAEDHDQVREAGRDEGVGVPEPDGAGGAHVLGPGGEPGRLDPERLGGEGGDVALERRALRHDRAHHDPLEVGRPQAGNRVEARLAGLPDEVAIRRLPHAEARHARSDQGHLPHLRLLQGGERRLALLIPHAGASRADPPPRGGTAQPGPPAPGPPGRRPRRGAAGRSCPRGSGRGRPRADVLDGHPGLRHELRQGSGCLDAKDVLDEREAAGVGAVPAEVRDALGPEAGLPPGAPGGTRSPDPRRDRSGPRAAPTCTARPPAGTAGRPRRARRASAPRRRPSRTARRRDTCPARGQERRRRPSRRGWSTGTAGALAAPRPGLPHPTRSRGTAPSARGPAPGRRRPVSGPRRSSLDVSAPRSRSRVTRDSSPRLAARWSGREASGVRRVHLRARRRGGGPRGRARRCRPGPRGAVC